MAKRIYNKDILEDVEFLRRKLDTLENNLDKKSEIRFWGLVSMIAFFSFVTIIAQSVLMAYPN